MSRAGPWFKMHTHDWIEATRGLSLEARAAFIDVLCMIYERDGPVPDDASLIAHYLHVSKRKWMAIRKELIAGGFIDVLSDGLHNKRAAIEIENRANVRRVNIENGAKPKRKIAEYSENESDINETSERMASVSLTESESDQDKDKNLDSRVNQPREALGAFVDGDKLQWLCESVLATPMAEHAMWLRRLLGEVGRPALEAAFARARARLDRDGIKNPRGVHGYIEKTASELAANAAASTVPSYAPQFCRGGSAQ